MQKKGAIGLSMNMIVIIIISLVILTSGVALLYKFIGGAEDLKKDLDQRTSQELERLLVDRGKQVALPLHVANLFAGESYVFGIGILNIKENDNEFKLEITLSRTVDKEGNLIVNENEKEALVTKWILYNKDIMVIEENEHRKEAILISLPNDALKGQYIFNAQVLVYPFDSEDQESKYDNIQKFTVNVN